MNVKSLKWNKEYVSYVLTGLASLLLITVIVFQYEGRHCQDRNTVRLIDQGYLASQTLMKFTTAWSNVWVVEKVNPKISPENELRGEATTSLEQAQIALGDFRKILNSKECLVWDSAEFFSLLFAFFAQTIALYISRYKKT